MSSSDPNENIRDLLSELAEDDAEALRPFLLSLRSMSMQSAPVPSTELAAMLKRNATAEDVAPVRLRRRRLVFALALIGALIAGTGTAAAVSPEFRSDAAEVLTGIINAVPFAHSGVVRPAPSQSPVMVHTPAAPANGRGTSHPAPSPGVSTHPDGEAKHSSGHVNPKSTGHPTPTADPSSNGRGRGTP